MYESCYAQGLSNLSAHALVVTSQGALSGAVAEMKRECGRRAETVRQFSGAIETQLVEPLRYMLQTQSEELKATTGRVKARGKELKGRRKALEEAKERYEEGFKQAEELVKKAEGLKSANEKKKLLAGKTDTINAALKAVLVVYKDALSSYNSYIPEFKKASSEALKTYQAQEEARVLSMSEALLSLSTLISSFEESLSTSASPPQDSSPRASCLADLHPLLTAITSNSPSDPTPLAFAPYQGSHWAFLDLGETAPDLQWTGSELQIRPQTLRSDSDFDETRQRIDSFMANAWRGEMAERDIEEFQLIVHESRGRRQWVSNMNCQRAAGKFKMDAEGFEAVAKAMNIVLDECEAANDITTGKSCIILSQTFHHFQGIQKEFLQARIVSHSLWRGEEIWNAIIKDGIDNEFAKQQICGAQSQESSDIKNVVFGQLSSFAHVMALFGVDHLVARKVLTEQCRTYSIDEEEGVLLLGIFTEESPTSEQIQEVRLPHSRSMELIDDLEEGKSRETHRRKSILAERS